MPETYRLDPLVDDRWDRFLEKHPDGSIFHTSHWLRALSRTYGYAAVVYTTAAPGQALTNGIPFCLVDSRLTGRRLVSLPFSDHCEPLAEGATDLMALLGAVQQDCNDQRRRYAEIRPLRSRLEYQTTPGPWGVHQRFFRHQIDLTGDLDALFEKFHKTAIQQPIHRAERDGVRCVEGTSDELLDEFYRLMILTRRRHRLPPQPRQWFRNLLDCLGDRARLYVARKDDRAIAAILTCHWGATITYKYSASDQGLARFGGTPFLIWKSLQAAKASGSLAYDMGRTDLDHGGLRVFKDRWAADRMELTYLRSPVLEVKPIKAEEHWGSGLARSVVGKLPDRLLVWAGKVLYRHMG